MEYLREDFMEGLGNLGVSTAEQLDKNWCEVSKQLENIKDPVKTDISVTINDLNSDRIIKLPVNICPANMKKPESYGIEFAPEYVSDEYCLSLSDFTHMVGLILAGREDTFLCDYNRVLNEVNKLPDYSKEKLGPILNLLVSNGIDLDLEDLILIINNTDQFLFDKGVYTSEDLGKARYHQFIEPALIDNNMTYLADFIDFKKLGDTRAEKEGGLFLKIGYICMSGELDELAE